MVQVVFVVCIRSALEFSHFQAHDGGLTVGGECSIVNTEYAPFSVLRSKLMPSITTGQLRDARATDDKETNTAD